MFVNIVKLFNYSALFFFIMLSSVPAKQIVQVAVSANFTETMRVLKQQFEMKNQCQINLSFASTSVLSMQIQQGADFDLFFSADKKHVSFLVKKHFALNKTRETYAIGQLVLWVPGKNLVHPELYFKKHLMHQRWVLPNPQVAPYGVAAQQVLKSLHLSPGINKHIILANNVNQVFLYIHQKVVRGGFVALSQIKQLRLNQHILRDDVWLVPANYYEPLVQEMVVLKHGEYNLCANKFYQFIKSVPVKNLISQYGYKI